MAVYPKIAHEVMSYQAIFILEVYAYLVVAVTLKTRSLRFAPLPGPAMLVKENLKRNADKKFTRIQRVIGL
ncbi:MAG: hypothetical protein L3J49_12530, partial [Desulfobulbaceae bacterium]|nr:hypothetical protein [Desulfobulbaceae bacterium]